MFTAEFDDGPMQGWRDEFLGVDEPFADLYAIPHPVPERGYVIVGYSGLEPEPPWPEQVHYRLAFSPDRPAPGEKLVGRYVLASGAGEP